MEPREQSQAEYDRTEPNIRAIVITGVGILLILAALLAGLQFYFNRAMERQVYVRVLAPEPSELKELRAREEEALGSYRYLDREKGIVRLPIARAMELLVNEYQQGRVGLVSKPVAVMPEEAR